MDWQNDPLMIRLQQMWTKLLAQMDAMAVVDELIDMFPPNRDEYQQVQCQPTARKKNRTFLQTIHVRGPEGVKRMLHALAVTGPAQRALAETFVETLDRHFELPDAPDEADSREDKCSKFDWSTPLIAVKGHPIWKTVCEKLQDKGTILVKGWKALLEPMGFVGVSAESIEHDSEAGQPIEYILNSWCKVTKPAPTINELARHLDKIRRRDAVDAIAQYLPPRRLRDRLETDQYEQLRSKQPEEVDDMFAYLSDKLLPHDCDQFAESVGVDLPVIKRVRYDCHRDATGGNRQLLAKWQQLRKNYNVATLIEKLEKLGCWKLAEDVAKKYGVAL